MNLLDHARRIRMALIQSRAGITLPDVYDVVGSNAPVQNLESENVHLSHEMGGTIMSERLSGAMVVLETIALAQTLTWDLEVAVPPRFTSRLFGVQVVTNQTVARSQHCQVSISDTADSQDYPIWAWNSGAGTDASRSIRMRSFTGTLGTFVQLVPGGVDSQLSPSLLIGTEQPLEQAVIRFRGLTATFGAGTVIHQAIIYQAFPALRGVSSRGLPVPSW